MLSEDGEISKPLQKLIRLKVIGNRISGLDKERLSSVIPLKPLIYFLK